MVKYQDGCLGWSESGHTASPELKGKEAKKTKQVAALSVFCLLHVTNLSTKLFCTQVVLLSNFFRGLSQRLTFDNTNYFSMPQTSPLNSTSLDQHVTFSDECLEQHIYPH